MRDAAQEEDKTMKPHHSNGQRKTQGTTEAGRTIQFRQRAGSPLTLDIYTGGKPTGDAIELGSPEGGCTLSTREELDRWEGGNTTTRYPFRSLQDLCRYLKTRYRAAPDDAPHHMDPAKQAQRTTERAAGAYRKGARGGKNRP